jgi:hypothetical protein
LLLSDTLGNASQDATPHDVSSLLECVLKREGVSRPVALDNNSLQAEQTGAIVSAMIDTPLEVPKHWNRKNGDQLG